ncbi:Battenin [Aphelenchoides besseyi]|nr:Battenin [Aphelenchoides besseyi]
MAPQKQTDLVEMEIKKGSRDWGKIRNFIAFWVFGLSNNMVYVIMLSAAEDIMTRQQSGGSVNANNGTETCEPVIEGKYCDHAPLGIILLVDIIPLILLKSVFPFVMHKISYGTQHVFIVTTQVLSYLIVAFSTSIPVSLIGVTFGAVGSQCGENTYLALSGHYSKNTISWWSSGTGAAGIGALVYAALTEPNLLDLTPQKALLCMLVVPFIFLLSYFFLLTQAKTIYRIQITRISTWIVPKNKGGLTQENIVTETTEKVKPVWTTEEKLESGSTSSETFTNSTDSSQAQLCGKGAPTLKDKLRILRPLLFKYVIPLSVVYYSQYLVNQGLAGFMIFDCAHSFGLSRESQYRWYQVIYQLGVFISRSSVNFIRLPLLVLLILPVLQAANAGFFFVDTFYPFVPHIAVTFGLILVQGFVGGFSYVNSFYRIHKEVPAELKEFSLSFISIAGPVGITLAGLSSIPIHKMACGWSS